MTHLSPCSLLPNETHHVVCHMDSNGPYLQDICALCLAHGHPGTFGASQSEMGTMIGCHKEHCALRGHLGSMKT